MKPAVAIPAYQAEATLAGVMAALRQEFGADLDLLVVDDGSTDATGRIAAEGGARVLTHQANLGRGAARASAMRETDSPLLVMCDATLDPAPGTISSALRWFDDSEVAAVLVTSPNPRP